MVVFHVDALVDKRAEITALVKGLNERHPDLCRFHGVSRLPRPPDSISWQVLAANVPSIGIDPPGTLPGG